jgi:hypothetical protein
MEGPPFRVWEGLAAAYKDDSLNKESINTPKTYRIIEKKE